MAKKKAVKRKPAKTVKGKAKRTAKIKPARKTVKPKAVKGAARKTVKVRAVRRAVRPRAVKREANLIGSPFSAKMAIVTMAAVVVATVVFAFMFISDPAHAGDFNAGQGSTLAGAAECTSSCARFSEYSSSGCFLPTEVPMPALETGECWTASCTTNCKCFCYGLEEPVVQEESCSGMTISEAIAAAEGSECLENSTLKDTRMCNEITGTWWIDLNLEKEGCNPACVIDTATSEAVINWRCTGLIV